MLLAFVDRMAREVAPMPEAERAKTVVCRLIGDAAHELSLLLEQAGADTPAHFAHGYSEIVKMILAKAQLMAQALKAADNATRH